MSTQPRSSLGTVVTSYPPKVTDAGLVPWAESGMITRWRSWPLASWKARMSRSPVSSPAAPAAGCRVAAAMPVISHSASSSSTSSSSQPWVRAAGAAGWTSASPGRAATASQTLGLYFMVHEPSG